MSELSRKVRSIVNPAALWAALGVITAGCSTHLYVLTRHAEKQGEGNTSLTPAGLQRAQALAQALSASKISAIYVTNVCRTAQTAQPLAQQYGITLQVQDLPGQTGFDACNPPIQVPYEMLPNTISTAAELVAYIEDNYKGATLIVGHSDTVDDLVSAIGAGQIQPIGDVFDKIFVVLRTRSMSSTTTKRIDARYGEPSE